MVEITYLMMQQHIPEEQQPQLLCCENLKTCKKNGPIIVNYEFKDEFLPELGWEVHDSP
jgi:hypothetical protein